MRTKPGRLGAKDKRSAVKVGGRSEARQVPNGFLFGARAARLRTAGKGSHLSRPPERRAVEKARECEPGLSRSVFEHYAMEIYDPTVRRNLEW